MLRRLFAFRWGLLSAAVLLPTFVNSLPAHAAQRNDQPNITCDISPYAGATTPAMHYEFGIVAKDQGWASAQCNSFETNLEYTLQLRIGLEEEYQTRWSLTAEQVCSASTTNGQAVITICELGYLSPRPVSDLSVRRLYFQLSTDLGGPDILYYWYLPLCGMGPCPHDA